MFQDSERYKKAMKAFKEAATHDIQLVEPAPQAKSTVELDASADRENARKIPYSVVYHNKLYHYVQELCHDPSEPLSLASYSQHIRRWEIPRSSYPEGLSGYKTWRFQLNKFHTTCAFDVLEASGYSQTEDADIFHTIANLLQKKTLKGGNDKGDEEMQIFEDAICLTFMDLEFSEFARKHDEEKMVKIVQKTWGKMGQKGKTYASENLAAALPEDAKAILMKALTTA